MIKVALKGLAGRKVRALLTAFAVVIGVSMVSGTFILTDTMQKTFDGLFAASYDRTDAVIEGKQIVERSTSGSATVPESLLADVRKLPGVAAAGGTVSPTGSNSADIIGPDGKAVAQQSLGTSIDRANPRLSPLRLKTGEWPSGPRQIVIDAGTADTEHYALGDTVRVATPGRTASYRLTGTASFGEADSIGFGSIAVWDVATAQALLERKGRFDSISIAAKDGTSPAALVRAVKPLIPSTLEVMDSAKKAAEDSAQADKAMSYIRYFLLGFGGIALFVGAFVIFNTLSITVAQRTREFATLRTLGASRKQVLRSVRLEGLAIGLIASVIGLFLGFGIAKGMLVMFSAMGVDLPRRTPCSRPARRSSRSCSARGSPCSRPSCPRGAPPACRRSPPSARARPCRSRASAHGSARGSWHPWSGSSGGRCAVPVGSPASWPARTPPAIPAGPRRPPPRSRSGSRS